ncbi:hypothetical protein [Streptomyces sp. NPDC050264]|uniref:hypothetical protein n=1 Tax=Streptomyces sp. NPDC050264 TaxID=3155038 RepID=UPI003436AA0C
MTDIDRARHDGSAPNSDPLRDPAARTTPEPLREPHEPHEPHEPREPRERIPGAGVDGDRTDPLAPDAGGTGHHLGDHGAGGDHLGDHHGKRHAGLEEPGHGLRTALVAQEAREDLTTRLRHAVAGFVDEPRAAVQEADLVLEDLTTRLTETLAGHRETLRTSWQGSEEDTERLRLALRDYRETAERLLNI